MALRASRRPAVHIACSSDLPFLYQTATILRGPIRTTSIRTHRNFDHHSELTCLARASGSRRLFSAQTSICAKHKPPYDFKRLSAAQEPEPGLEPKSSFLEEKKRLYSKVNQSSFQSTITPAERRIFAEIFQNISGQTSTVSEHSLAPSKQSQEDIEWLPSLPETPLEQDKRSLYDKIIEESEKQGSMTATEKSVLDKLFKDQDTKQDNIVEAVLRPPNPPKERRAPKTTPLESLRQGNAIDAIFAVAIQKQNKATSRPKLGTIGGMSIEELAEILEQKSPELDPAIQRYPPPLRESALRSSLAMRKANDEEALKGPPRQTIKFYIEKELEKIEAALSAAATSGHRNGDLDIWAVCEENIFSMLGQLDGIPIESDLAAQYSNLANPTAEYKLMKGSITVLEQDKELHAAKEASHPEKAASPAAPSPDIEHTAQAAETISPASLQAASKPVASTLPQPALPLDIPAEFPALAIVSEIYPEALSLALRTLYEHFPGSPLLLQMLPTIKALGSTSYVLGGSSKLYNTLLEIKWKIYNDVDGCIELLAEMEGRGISFTRPTLALLEKISSEWAQQKRMQPGDNTNVWWNLRSTKLRLEDLVGQGDSWLQVVNRRVLEHEASGLTAIDV